MKRIIKKIFLNNSNNPYLEWIPLQWEELFNPVKGYVEEAGLVPVLERVGEEH